MWCKTYPLRQGLKLATGEYMNLEVKNVAAKLHKLQKNLKMKVESTALYNEVKKKVKTSSDVKKVVAIVEQRKKQIERIAKNLPKEVNTVKNFLESQRKELEKLGTGLLAKAQKAQGKAVHAKVAKPKTTAKKASTKATAARKTTKKAAVKN